MAILLFILVLFVLVFAHELGHFFIAKKTGMRVDEFGIGFPPRLFGITRGETTYSVNALPLGGFVRIYGEDSEETAITPDAHALNDRSRAFSQRPRWAQVAVLLGGIGANVLFAWLLFSTVLASGTLVSVSAKDATADAGLYILDIVPDSPASHAGIPLGSTVVAVSAGDEARSPRSPEEFRAFVGRFDGVPVTLSYRHGGEEQSVVVTPARDVLDGTPSAVAIGVSLDLAEVQRLPIHRALIEGFSMTVRGIRDIAVGIALFFASALTLDANFSEVAGPVGIAGLAGEASALGFSSLLLFTAFISLNLAVINVLPFPALDGGRLLFVLIEAVKGSPLPAKVAYYTNATGFAILILLMVAITYHDIVKLV